MAAREGSEQSNIIKILPARASKQARASRVGGVRKVWVEPGLG